jgi:integrase
MYLVEPTGPKLKWDIRFRNHDGRVVRVPGDRDPAAATRIGERCEMLVKAKRNGDPPPGELASWIANMDDGLADRLIDLGLVPLRHRARNTPLVEWIEPWVQVISGRKPNSQKHAPQQGRKVRRIITAIRAIMLAALEPDLVTEKINAFTTEGCKNPTPISTATRRSYGIAIKDFSCWLARKLKVENPLAEMPVPGQYENPEYERQPLTVPQFRQLTAYLSTFERYRNQKARWTASDRKIIYWTAVKTGYRESELKKLRRWNLYLDETPAVICLKARDTKTKTKGEVPIPRDLAVALKKYAADLEPGDRVFPFPETSGSIVDMLRRDLEGAGVPWKLPSGEVVDFHTLRATCITWWLDVDGLKPKRVQVLARLKGLGMVQNYSRNLRIEDFEWLDKGPRLVSTRRRKRSA